jgi:hypothetical protein
MLSNCVIGFGLYRPNLAGDFTSHLPGRAKAAYDSDRNEARSPGIGLTGMEAFDRSMDQREDLPEAPA